MKNFKDDASTADEYREVLRDSKENSALTTKVREYLVNNSEVTEYPKDYLEQLKALKKFEDLVYFQNVNNYYAETLGDPLYPNFSSYINMTEAKYDRSLSDVGKTIAKLNLIYQAIAEQEGIKSDEAAYLAYMLEHGETQETFDEEIVRYGRGYLMQAHIGLQALDFVKQHVTIQK